MQCDVESLIAVVVFGWLGESTWTEAVVVQTWSVWPMG